MNTSLGESNSRMRRAARTFTLIELLVVIVIMAILMSILLPALSLAKYAAKNVACIGQLKQISLGFVSYADDYDMFWPDFGEPLADPTQHFPMRPRSKTMCIAGWGNNGVLYDLRPSLREYLGPLNDMMKCPLASPKWRSDAPEADIDNYDMGWYHLTQTSYNLYATGHGAAKFHQTTRQMRRVGQSFIPHRGTAWGHKYNIIASDVVTRAQGRSNTLLTTQRPYGAAVEEYDLWINQACGWAVPAGVKTTANYALDDGSVTSYKVDYYSASNSSSEPGSFRNSGFYLPVDLEQ